jgi:hypothetical protein
LENGKRRYQFGEVGLDGRIILKWVLKKQVLNWIYLAWEKVQ